MVKKMIKITGIGVAYPPNSEGLEELDKAAHALCKPSPARDKLLAFSRSTGIKSRSLVVPYSSLAQGNPPPIMGVDEMSAIFLKHGVALAVSAARAAIKDAGISVGDITHVVSSTCTNSSNPGYDVLVARDLGLRPTVEKVLLHGVGCTGGLAGLRLASTLCDAAASRGRPANVLVVASEITSPLGRWYLDCLDKNQEFPIGLAIYGDGASALVVSLDTNVQNGQGETGIFEVVSSTHMIVPGTEDQLTFNVTPHGWKEHTSPQVPQTYRNSIPIIYKGLLDTVPPNIRSLIPTSPSDFDWPIQGSYFLINAVKRALGLDRDNFKASWELYENYANTSSSSFGCALDISRRIEQKEWLVSVGFGGGVAGEAVLLRRIQPQRPVRAVL
ncbi:thiolase-like protein [Mycena latifolia]|nr:thiolase-like protein [Mycena latifolia]